jgi:hypothetical protein
MKTAATLFSLAALSLSLGSTGCIKQMLIDGQIEGTRQGADAADTIADYELAKGATEAGILQFEGMHVLSPKNEDALFLLTKGWTGYGFGFIDDERERADDAGDDELQEYHQRRAQMAFMRAMFYGAELLSHKADGFEQAKKNDQSIHTWLQQFDDTDKDTGNLFWTGYAYMARADLMKSSSDPEGVVAVGELFIGVAMIERATQLDPSYSHYSGLIALAAYHARPMVDAAELEQGRQLFETALLRSQRKNLMVQVNYARAYACAKGDKKLYETLLNEVLDAPDPDPQQRLTNAIAKRRAKRYLAPIHEQECSLK